MTTDQALHWLNTQVPQEETPQDQLEALYFSIRQQLFSKPALAKLFASRLEILEMASEAEQVLGIVSANISWPKQELSFPENLTEAYELFTQQQALFRGMAAQVSDARNLKKAIELLIRLQKAWANYWYLSDLNTEGVLVSREPDPMVLQEAIRQFHDLGGQDMADLKQGMIPIPEILLNEQKRLSLLHKSF